VPAPQNLDHELEIHQIELEAQKVELHRAQEEIQDAREYAESIVEAVREPLVVLNSKLKILTTNNSF
jgi:nitrogen fixation/metabolism regulation signal transduction histidine kinase